MGLPPPQDIPLTKTYRNVLHLLHLSTLSTSLPTFNYQLGKYGHRSFFGHIHPRRLTWNIMMEVDGRWFSFSNRWFLGSMLIFQGVDKKINFIHVLTANARPRHSSVPKWVRLPTDCLDPFLTNSFSCSSAWPERKYVKKERAKATCECRETLENDDSPTWIFQGVLNGWQGVPIGMIY